MSDMQRLEKIFGKEIYTNFIPWEKVDIENYEELAYYLRDTKEKMFNFGHLLEQLFLSEIHHLLDIVGDKRIFYVDFGKTNAGKFAEVYGAKSIRFNGFHEDMCYLIALSLYNKYHLSKSGEDILNDIQILIQLKDKYENVIIEILNNTSEDQIEEIIECIRLDIEYEPIKKLMMNQPKFVEKYRLIPTKAKSAHK